MSTSEVKQPDTSAKGVGKPDLRALWQAAKDDQHELQQLWQTYGNKLLQDAARIAEPSEIVLMLDTASDEPRAEQIVMESSAIAGNVALFKTMLQHMQDPYLGKSLRAHATRGGVDVWRALLEYNHDCINWELGDRGTRSAKRP